MKAKEQSLWSNKKNMGVGEEKKKAKIPKTSLLLKNG